MFKKVLVANRGEIALRVIRACKELGIKTVAIHSEADAGGMHARAADERICVGPPEAALSYRNIPNVLSAAEITGADAIHPGYGFLSENARFAEAVEAHGFTFIGPTPQHISMMGDKIVAKQTAQELGLPLVPGSPGPVTLLEEVIELGKQIGWPVLIKAVAGGGGRGMRLVREAAGLPDALRSARSEAQSAFGDAGVILERAIVDPRHIEIQVFGDRYGGWKASIIAGALMGILIDFAALLTYPLQAQFFQGTGLMFGGGDYILWAPLYWLLAAIGGKVAGFGTYGVVSIIAGILVLVGVIILRNEKAKENAATPKAPIKATPVPVTK